MPNYNYQQPAATNCQLTWVGVEQGSNGGVLDEVTLLKGNNKNNKKATKQLHRKFKPIGNLRASFLYSKSPKPSPFLAMSRPPQPI